MCYLIYNFELTKILIHALLELSAHFKIGSVFEACLYKSDWCNVFLYLGSIDDQIATCVDRTWIIEYVKVFLPKLIVECFDKKLSLDLTLLFFEIVLLCISIKGIAQIFRGQNILCSWLQLNNQMYQITQKTWNAQNCNEWSKKWPIVVAVIFLAFAFFLLCNKKVMLNCEHI